MDPPELGTHSVRFVTLRDTDQRPVMARTEGVTVERPDRAMLLVVPALLLLVASLQVARVATLDQSTWIGGGFGMFATYDYDDTRAVVAFWETPDGPIPADLVAVSRQDLLRLRVVPSADNARRIASQLIYGGVVEEASLLVVEVRGRRLADDMLTFPTLVRVEVDV
ncbi:MAG: hypothetical protein R3249_00040 [Nitriliruptorales bacterium]|nr:hypothetical protein [Nitriliruptorales bacterium]